MKIISKTLKLLTVFLLVLGVTGCSDDDDTNGGGVMTTTIVDVALSNGLTSLAAALEATDLVTALQGTGPFTVFAPTNDAFTALLTANNLDLDNLSTAEETLVRNILLNHVIQGENISAEAIIGLGSGYRATMSPGPAVNTNLSTYFNVVGGVVEINGGSNVSGGADVVIPNVTATNGTVHVVDAIIALPTIATFATTNGALGTLVAALDYAANNDTNVDPSYLSLVADGTTGPFTVFAPVNDAFLDPTTGVLAELGLSGFGEGMGELNGATTNAVLEMHIVGGNFASSTLAGLNGLVPTLGGDLQLDLDTLTLTDGDGRDIGIIASLIDIQGTNGVVHVVDRVIRP